MDKFIEITLEDQFETKALINVSTIAKITSTNNDMYCDITLTNGIEIRVIDSYIDLRNNLLE